LQGNPFAFSAHSLLCNQRKCDAATRSVVSILKLLSYTSFIRFFFDTASLEIHLLCNKIVSSCSDTQRLEKSSLSLGIKSKQKEKIFISCCFSPSSSQTDLNSNDVSGQLNQDLKHILLQTSKVNLELKWEEENK